MRGSIPVSLLLIWDGFAFLHRDQLTQTCSFASRFGFPHLPDLQEMSIRVKEEGPGLLSPIERRGNKLRSIFFHRCCPSRFSSDPCEFFRIGNDANCLNLPLLHLNGQDGECLVASADDHGCLTVDFL